MLRVTTIHVSSAAASAAYYTRYLADAPGEASGVWTGQQAAGLGLGGRVNADDLETVLEGRDPTSRTPLGNPLVDRTLSNGKVVRAVAGFDATFSAPKSVSVWWALTGDPGLLAAHDVAVTAALEHLERYGATTRVRVSGARHHPDTLGLTMATFRQSTSRADDPQLHTHAVISAKVQTHDGRWLALDARYLKRHQRMLGGLYQSVLRAELTHRYGIAWEPIVNGQAEIAGMPLELIDVFSKRASEVDAALAAKVDEFREREGRDPTTWERAAMTREASADTRAHKSGNGVIDLRTRWETEAGDLGWTAADLDAELRAAGRDRAEPDSITVDDVIDGLSASGSTWNRADVMRAITDRQAAVSSMDGHRWAAALDRACDRVIEASVDLDPVGTSAQRRSSDGRSLWIEPTAPHLTSDAIVAEEEFVLSWAMDAQVDDPEPSPSIEADGLDVLQAEAAAAVAGTDRLVLIVGPAGAGKTTTLRRAVDDLADHDRPVFGVAPTAKAAAVLGRETPMATDTLAKLLHEWTRPDRPPSDHHRLAAGTTLIVDEAGMVGTASLAQLVRLAEQRGWRLALVGDPRQLQAVGRGGLFNELCATGRTHELSRIHRFHQPWEAAASLQLRDANPAALAAYEAHDRIVAGPFEQHLDHLAQQWCELTHAGRSVAITAATNDHVDAINGAIQGRRLAAGELPVAGVVSIAGGEIGYPGDVIATRRNDRELRTTDEVSLQVVMSARGVTWVAQFSAGDWAAARATSRAAKQLDEHHERLLWALHFAHVDGLLAALTGDDDIVARSTDRLLETADAQDGRLWRLYARHVLVFDAASRGDFDAVYRHATAIGSAGAFPEQSPIALWVFFELVHAAVRTGRLVEARRHVAAAQQLRIEEISPRLAMFVAAAEALVTTDPTTAGQRFAHAVGGDELEAWPFDRARVRLAYGEHLRRHRVNEDARRQFELA